MASVALAEFDTKASDARARLRRKKERGAGFSICEPSTHIVVEGPPRCANSFTVRMLHNILGRPQKFRIAHHSHSPDNIWAGAGYGIPLVVLARAPEDSISSNCIRSGKSPRNCASRYAAFYEALDGLDGYVIGHFDEIISDFNAFITRINKVMVQPIPLVDDLPGLVARVQAERQAIIAAKRARTEATPIAPAERERIKAETREHVLAYLESDARPREAFERFVAAGDRPAAHRRAG